MHFKKLVAIVSFIFLLGAALLSFFTILSGARKTGVLKNFYWIEAVTEGFGSAPEVTRWTNYDWCGYTDGSYHIDCSKSMAAQSFSPKDNFGANPTMPSAFLNDRNTYYYLSRVGWAMLLIGLFFTICAIIPAIFSLFSNNFGFLGSVFLTILPSWIAFFFITLSACLYTACYTKARRVFRNDSRSASLGTKNFAFIWTSVFLLLVSSLWYTISATAFGVMKFKQHRKSNNYGYESSSGETYNVDKSTVDSAPAPAPAPAPSRGPAIITETTDTEYKRNNQGVFGGLFKKKRVQEVEYNDAVDTEARL